MSISLSEPFIDDIREPIAGDSFNWEGTEPAAAKKSLVIHHSGTNTALSGGKEDGFSIANYHVNGPNKWGGIGYHFVITHDSHPGGARVQYVGDLLSWRAHVYDQNPGRVGICLVGNFLQQLPGQNQLRLARELINFLMAPNDILPSINYFSQVLYHNGVPEQSTDCPGWQGAHFGDWFGYLQGGVFPDGIYNIAPPAPAPAPAPTPAPVEPTPEPTPVLDPEWVRTWNPGTLPSMITKVPVQVIDVTTGAIKKILPADAPIESIAGTFEWQGNTYIRTLYSLTNNIWNGILMSDLVLPSAPIPTPVPVDGIQPPEPQQPAAPLPPTLDTTPPKPKLTFKQAITQILAILVSPALKLYTSIKNRSKKS